MPLLYYLHVIVIIFGALASFFFWYKKNRTAFIISYALTALALLTYIPFSTSYSSKANFSFNKSQPKAYTINIPTQHSSESFIPTCKETPYFKSHLDWYTRIKNRDINNRNHFVDKCIKE